MTLPVGNIAPPMGVRLVRSDGHYSNGSAIAGLHTSLTLVAATSTDVVPPASAVKVMVTTALTDVRVVLDGATSASGTVGFPLAQNAINSFDITPGLALKFHSTGGGAVQYQFYGSV